MNLYIVVEGEEACIELYKNWVKHINNNYNYKDNISDIVNNDFIIIAGFGYPFYKKIIEDAIVDVNTNQNIDKLVVCVDSEDYSFQEKYDEIEQIIVNNGLTKPYSIVIQHFCIETWFLGNRKINSKNISNPILRKYKKIFDVHKNDPELLPAYEVKELNRSQFAYKYFRYLLQEKYNRLTYSKNNASVVTESSFFHQVNKRFTTTNHIRSFKTLLDAFR